MTRNEALLHLPVEEGELLSEAYEEKLFYWKKFFVNRFPVAKLFHKKIHQLHQLERAYEVLGGVNEGNSIEIQLNIKFSDELKPAFHQFTRERNALKTLLFQARTAVDIIEIVRALLRLTEAYAEVWRLHGVSTDGSIISKELDPMDLLAALEDAERNGVITSDDITKLPEDHAVRNEAKRLSLWMKMNGHE